MRRTVALLLLCGFSLAAQQTIVQKLFTDDTSGNVDSAPVQNLGQVGHIVYVQFSNNVGNCTTPQGNASLQYSFDKVTWVNFGLPNLTGHSLVTLTQAFYGSGVFNYVRFHLDWVNNASCKATAWYTGTSAFGPLSQNAGPLPNASTIDDGVGTVLLNPLFVGGIGTLVLRPLLACDKTAQATITTGTESLIASPSVLAASGRVVVCSMAVTMATTGTFQLDWRSASNCTGTQGLISPPWNLNAGIPLTMGGGLGSIAELPGAAFLCGIATGGNANVMVSYLTY